MTRRERRTIFYALLGLFFVLGTGVVLYAEGWRIDFKNWRPEKVGAIYVRSFPQYTGISLDGKSVPSGAGLLSRGTLISDLYPRTYTLALEAQGYDAWRENAAVLPSLVTEFNDAVLVPSAGTPAASGTVQTFVIGGGVTATEGTNGQIIWRGRPMGRGTIVALNADLTSIIIKNSGGIYTFHDPESTASVNLSALFAANGLDETAIRNAVVDPASATRIVISTARRVWLFDGGTAAPTLAPIDEAPAGSAIGPALAVSTVSPSLLAWTRFSAASDSSAVVLYDEFAGTLAINTTTVPGRTVALAWVKPNALGVLQNAGSLYLYDAGARTFAKLADDATSFSATADGSLLAALERHGLEIFAFTSARTYHRFNLPNASSATGVIWYRDMDHLFVEYPDRVAFLSLDDLGLANLTTVAEGTAPSYDPSANALYMIDPHHVLMRFNFP